MQNNLNNFVLRFRLDLFKLIEPNLKRSLSCVEGFGDCLPASKAGGKSE